MEKVKARNQHVIPFEGKWAVHSEGSKRIDSVFETKQEAIDAALEIAGRFGKEIEVVVHGRLGQPFFSSNLPSTVSKAQIRQAVRGLKNGMKSPSPEN